MTDLYQQFVSSGPGKAVAQRLGLPRPVLLRRYAPDQPIAAGPVLLGGHGRLLSTLTKTLEAIGIQIDTETVSPYGLVFDATGITTPEQLRELYDFFHPVVRSVRPSGRVLVLGTPPESAESVAAAVAQRALEGFVRSLGKEVGRGATAQLVYVAEGAEDAVDSTLRFFLSAKSAYVSGQVIRIGAAEVPDVADQDRPLDGKVALVTGASRGIGASIAKTLARDGAHVVCLDVPAQGEDLSRVANTVGGSSLQLDITSERAPAVLAEHLTTRHGGVDIVVHNAGVIRDKTLGRMSEAQWDSVLAVNLVAQARINEHFLAHDVLRSGGRVVGLASIAGIAGNAGQTNYSTTKAGVIGLAQTLAPKLHSLPATINAVAPGFIETKMTASMPVTVREVGRRLNSLAQGGRPIDVAETIAWLAHPGSAGVTGCVVRVCGQSLLGA
jgi:3-oxoacyl-[acyl-carrier protein] reductase